MDSATPGSHYLMIVKDQTTLLTAAIKWPSGIEWLSGIDADAGPVRSFGTGPAFV